MPKYFSPVFNDQTFDALGNPLVGGKVETYIAGTSTPLATYTTQSGSTPQANPIILNARGEATNPIWLAAGSLYKFILKDSGGSVLRTLDNIGGVNDSSLSVSEWAASGFTPTYISATSFSVTGDQTATFLAGRRTRSTNTGGTVYSTISSSSYSSGTGRTTVVIVNDSSTLDSGLSAVDVGILTPLYPSVPNSQAFRQAMGLGYGADIASAATLDLTARTGNIVRITGTVATSAVTLSNGDYVVCIPTAAWPLTYNVTTNPLQGGVSYTCTPNDLIFYWKDNSGALHNQIVKVDGNSVNPTGFRNRIINGGMAIDQRNVGAAQTFTAAAALAYCVDRWYGYCTGANVNGQRVAGSGANQYRYQFTGAASVTGIGFGQRIEKANCIDLAGNTATLSVDLANSLLTTVNWTAYYANTDDTFGTLDIPTRTQIATGSFTVNSSVTRYNAQIAIPGAATTGIEVVFSVGAQVSGTFVIGNVQLEAGASATSFERRPINSELDACQRYFEKLGAIVQSSFANGGTGFAEWWFKVAKRAAPTLSLGGGSSAVSVNDVDRVETNAVGYAYINVPSTATSEL